MACFGSFDLLPWTERVRLSPDVMHWVTASSSTFALIAAAEIGDKSQLVCMTLAARHRHWPIVLGASCSFALLNLLAVLFGAAVARWVPDQLIAAAVAVLFTLFGLRALFTAEEDGNVEPVRRSGHGLFVTTFLLIFIAEFGDKTQLAVGALSATLPPTPVWVGGTLALIMTSALGVWAGRAFLRHLPLHWLHRLSGILFLGFAGFAAWRLVPEDVVTRLLEGFDALLAWARSQVI